MTRKARGALLCEDRQHHAFVRRFLKRAGWNVAELRHEVSPKGRGSGAEFVRRRFPQEVRSQRGRSARACLIAIIDGDAVGYERRLRQLEEACDAEGASTADHANVFVLAPSRNIETWFAYLDGDSVNETEAYPRLQRERDCQRHVDELHRMCEQNELRQPAPPSLEHACEEYRRFRQQNA